LIAIENPAYRRAIIQHHGAGRIGFGGRRVRRAHEHAHGGFGIVCREVFRRLDILPLEHGLFDFPQATHLVSHLNLGMTVRLQHRLGHIPQEMVVAVAMRHVQKFRRDRCHEGVLLVRNPKRDRFVQGFGPFLGLGDQSFDLFGRRGNQGLGEPDALLGQFPHDVEGLVSLLGLQAVDGENQLVDRFLLLPQNIGVLLAGGEHDLIAMDVLTDRVVRKLDPVVVEEFALDLRNRPVPRQPPMPDPAKDVPADRPMRWGDARFDFGTLGFAMPRTTGVGTMVELTDQLRRAFQRMNVTIPVIADVHHVPTDRAIAIKDVEFPLREISIRRPMVRHRADLHALVRSLK
jgi:hypothetical protein